MKNHLLKMGMVCLLISLKLSAQNIQYSSGQTFKTTPDEELTYLANGENHVLYLLHSSFSEKPKRMILKVNKSNLSIAETLDLYADKVMGNLNLIQQLGNDLYLFFRTEEKNGYKTSGYSVEALRMNTEKALSEYQNIFLGDFEPTENPYVYYQVKDQLFYISGKTNKYYNLDLKESKPPVKEKVKESLGNFTDWRFKSFSFDDPFSTNEIKGVQSYFYPISYHPQIFVESFYKADPASIGRQNKAFTSIEISLYNSYTESKTEFYKLPLKPGHFILAYDAHVLSDTSILIFGSYQAKGNKPGEIRLGYFSSIINREMKALTDMKYFHLFEGKKDKIDLDPKYRLIMKSWGEASDFELLSKSNEAYAVLKFNTHLNLKSYTFGLIKVNRKTGEISADYLFNESESSLVWEDFPGFYLLELSSTYSLLFFNDHKKNTDKPAAAEKLVICDIQTKTAVFSYVSYSTDSGFSKRNALIQANTEKYILDIERPDITYLGVKPSGEHEFILAAYDQDKKTGKFYKITISP